MFTPAKTYGHIEDWSFNVAIFLYLAQGDSFIYLCVNFAINAPMPIAVTTGATR
jgi:hypothetical protein